MEKRSQNRSVDSVFRHQWVSESAYYKAETRNFEPGMELNDWLYAENEYVKMLIIRYLAMAKEDGGMTITGLQGLAKSVGIENPENIHFKIELIQAIQKAIDDDPCFRSKPVTLCSEEECIWKYECRKLIAKWCL